tara:strand:- start:524 stop:1333 length:810 start_codon:yes stop_codon:yes gene_type:complete
MISFIKNLRHNSILKRYQKFWLQLGNIYRFLFSYTNLYFKIGISKYGKFYLHNKFLFSNFENWSSKHNSQFDIAIDLCKEKKIIIDVGAHIGLFSLCAARNSENNSKIFAFEPAKLNYSFLENHIKRNNFQNKIISFKLLLGNNYEITELFTEDEVSGKNSISNYNQKFQNSEKIEQTTIDFFCKDKNIIPEIIKIDAEGAELDILKGSINILKSYHPIIFLSVHPKILSYKKQTTDELFNLLKNLNYKVFDKNDMETDEFLLDEYICK